MAATTSPGTDAGTQSNTHDKPYVLSVPLDRELVESLRGQAHAQHRSLAGHVRFVLVEALRAS